MWICILIWLLTLLHHHQVSDAVMWTDRTHQWSGASERHSVVLICTRDVPHWIGDTRPAGWYASSLELLIYPHLCKWRWRARIAAVGYCVMNIWYVWFIATQLGDGWSIMAALCWRDWAREERRWWHESQHRTKEAGELRNTKKRGSPQNRFTGSDVCPERVRNVAPRCRIREGLKRWWKQKAYPTFSSCVGGKYPFKTYIRCFFFYINHSH